MPLSHTSSPTGRLPSTTRENFHSQLYGSRVAGSNSLGSGNTAELRRRVARSQMLQTLPQDDDMLDDFPTLLDSDNPWRAMPEPETDPWIRSADRAAMLRDSSSRLWPHAGSFASEPLGRDRSSNRLLRPYSSSSLTSRAGGRPDDTAHRFDPLPSPPSDSSFIRDAGQATSLLGRDRTQPHELTPSSVSATSPPPSPGFGLQPFSRRIPHRTRAFSSSVSSPRGVPTLVPPSAPSPVAWEDGIHSTAYSPLETDSSIPRQHDYDSRARARRRSSLVDVGSIRPPSPLSPTERVPRSREPPRATPVSTYGNLDLSAYHEGPFRASMQRYVDLDRIRSRLNRFESLADNVSSPSGPSSQRAMAPSLPPLRFDGDDDFFPVRGVSRGAFHAARHVRTLSLLFWRYTYCHHPQPSPTNGQDLNFPHLVREARLGRGSFPTALQNTQNYGPDIDETASVMETDIRAERDPSWRNRMDSHTAINHSTSPYPWENDHRLQMERVIAYDARMQLYRSQMISGDSQPNTRTIPPSPPLFAEGEFHPQTDRSMEERVNSHTTIRARVRAQMDARTQARIDAQRAENAGTSGFGEAMDILSADGLSNSTQRQFFDRYQRAREAADTDSISTVDNDPGESVSRFWPTRARYARRGRVFRPSQSGESPTSSHTRSSSRSPTRNGGSSSAVLADRAARLRATRERVQRDREFMLADFPRSDLLGFTQRAGRNMGDYMVRSISSTSSNRGLIICCCSGMKTLIHHMRACYPLRQHWARFGPGLLLAKS
jgi:hypothetical protein